MVSRWWVKFAEGPRLELPDVHWLISVLSEILLGFRCERLIVDSRFDWLRNAEGGGALSGVELSLIVLGWWNIKLLVIMSLWLCQHPNNWHIGNFQVRFHSVTDSIAYSLELVKSCFVDKVLDLSFVPVQLME